MNIAIIIPTYNSENHIRTFMTDIMKVISTVEGIKFSFTFIDDGSTDNTVKILKEEKKHYENISILVFSKNFGQSNAILAGLKYSQAEAYILMSVDMQESPLLIHDFIKYWQEGYKLTIAYRKYRSDNSIRALFSKIFYFIIRLDKSSIPQGGFDYGLMDDDVAKALIKKPFNYRFLQGDIVDLGYDIKYLPYERARGHLTSNKFKVQLFNFNYFFDGVINVVRIPFRLILLFSALITILASFNLLFHIAHTLYSGDDIWTPWLFKHFSILVMSFILLLVSFAVEFLARIYDIVMKKEEYVIKEFVK